MVPNKETFCIAPFAHMNVTSKGYARVCCVSNEQPTHRYNEAQTWFANNTMQSLRHNLIRGVKDPICSTCWKDEKVGKESLRKFYNKYVGNILEQVWNKNFEKNKKLQDLIKNIDFKKVESFDFSLGNLCNLKCIMCSPKKSSKILVEAKLNPELEKYYDDELNYDYTWPEKIEFKKWCDQHLTSATYMNFTGGEPFMNPYLLNTLDTIDDTQKSKCILNFSTNLTKINKKVISILKKFKNVYINVSVEGIGATLEYARYGHKWNDLETNLMKILEVDNTVVSISHVIQAPTIKGIKKLVEYFDNCKIDISPIFLTEPNCYQIQSIKTKYKEGILDSFENYNGHNKKYVSAVTNFIKHNMDYNVNLAKQCVYRLKSFDKVRKNKFQDVIPVDYFI